MLICIVTCADPGTPVNGTRSFTNDTLEGSVVTYTCDTGFTLVGTAMQTCVLELDGPVWRNGSLPTCASTALKFIIHCLHVISYSECLP